MLRNMPSLGIRFDIDKLESAMYGVAAWKVFWRAVDVRRLGPSLLFEGDTWATTKGSENVLCIVVQSFNADFGAVQSALEKSSEFQSVKASPPFVGLAEVQGEPLQKAGQIDVRGDIVGEEAYNTRPALDAVRKESQEGRWSTKKWWQFWK